MDVLKINDDDDDDDILAPPLAENLHSLERAECMMVRWMCDVSLKNSQK